MTEHIPVLLDSVVEHILPHQGLNSFMDGTYGRGGHSKAIIETHKPEVVFLFDRDLDAIEQAKTTFPQFKVIHANFADLDKHVGDQKFDGILIDLGVSSPQLDVPQRGFSFYDNGPLDMRMNQSDDLQAKDIVNNWSEDELNEIFKKYGELRRPGRVVRQICESRKDKPFESTLDLADCIARVEGWRKKGRHPATQYFLALRVVVNNEIEFLKPALEKLVDHLNPGGRLLVITFHSSEDRIVKWTFKEMTEKGKPVFKKVIKPTREEEQSNPRSRSAKLRVFERSAL